jgi:lipoprotein signal peptidase
MKIYTLFQVLKFIIWEERQLILNINMKSNFPEIGIGCGQSFTYNKKHFGFFKAITKIFYNLMSAKIKFVYYFITFNNYKKKIYQMRLSGLFNSMIGKKSFYRPKLDN